jgi:hypothetical protein
VIVFLVGYLFLAAFAVGLVAVIVRAYTIARAREQRRRTTRAR